MLLAVGLSLLITISLYFIFSSSISLPEILGIMFGAVTSTPGLGATQEALQSLGSKQDITVLRLSVCDPFCDRRHSWSEEVI
jgi:putative transport protein